ncbi:MAG: mannosyl-3-phosphoglycerate synthase [Desulfurococcales archaeon]|nr:mannosyl-3-phosphoglycerate synthase [Desulfurococcales archaeon]MCE4626912.1 mannosyl-3-phosphoglycerate synthase [Desulfurococcales archaeon]MCE4629110.1 mannosyl-3-phosphoglycerate synthase [Desulfurococcales archaeon]
MLIEHPHRFETYGAVRIYDVIKVLELDASGYRGHRGSYTLDCTITENIAAQTAIVIPVKNEDLLTLEGVISAVPHLSPIILVSASSRKPADRYRYEVELARSVHTATRRNIVVVHQHDPVWGEVLAGTSLEQMIDKDTGTIKKGKGEGMLLGVLVAAALGMKYVGFIDSDNYVPGAAHEYAWIYYSGFSLSTTPYTMVRIKWPFKGKLAASDVYLRRRGRVSMTTNSIMNYALTLNKKVETDIIQTANSGEHAMSIELALKMKWASGFAVEPYQLVDLLEKCYLGLSNGDCNMLPEGISIYQIESRNPHIHAERGDEHIVEMTATSLGTIYHSKLADEKVKTRITKILREYNWEDDPPKPVAYDPSGVNPEKVFMEAVSLSNNIYLMKVL